MKRNIWLTVTISAFLFSGCSTVGEDATKKDSSSAEGTAVEEEKGTEEENNGDKGKGTDLEAATYPEYETVMEQVKGEDYTVYLETDNPGSRVMFLVDQNGEKSYKTVFVKEEKQLKIIHLGNEGIIFNDTI